MGFFSRVESSLQTWVLRLDILLRFIPRLVIGVVFVSAGWGKLQGLSRTIGFFESLNIPLASVAAPIVALLEVICGLCILVGLYTRAASLPLIAILVTAIATAHKSEFKSILSLTEMNTSLYIVILLCVFALGSGPLSLEQIFFRRR